MKKRNSSPLSFFVAILCICMGLSGFALLPEPFAAGPPVIELPVPQTSGGLPLMDALTARKSLREYSTEKLSLQVLSNLLWATWGINRPESGLRTAPSAHNAQEIDIYVSLEEGLYLYDAQKHQLNQILDRDIRLWTAIKPQQAYVEPAPVNLVYVADKSKMMRDLCFADTGFIAQNAYLYCASAGLATTVRGAIPWWLHRLMRLSEDQLITLCQTIGYPAEGGGTGKECLTCHGNYHGNEGTCLKCHQPHY